MRNPSNILRHEFIGLHCRVTKSKNKSQIGIEGKIAHETMKTINVGNKKVQKKDAEFMVELNGKNVYIDGNFIIARPEDRIKKKIKKW